MLACAHNSAAIQGARTDSNTLDLKAGILVNLKGLGLSGSLTGLGDVADNPLLASSAEGLGIGWVGLDAFNVLAFSPENLIQANPYPTAAIKQAGGVATAKVATAKRARAARATKMEAVRILVIWVVYEVVSCSFV